MSRAADGLVSFHGGHSGQFCAHAEGTLEEVVRAAVAQGLTHYGISEHAPKSSSSALDVDELSRGLSAVDTQESFRELAEVEFPRLRAKYEGQVTLLLGLETDAVPQDGFVERTLRLREQYGVEYLVGSVHHVHEVLIDGSKEDYREAAARCGDEEALHLFYFRLQAQLIEGARPEVVGHLDLIRKHSRLPSIPDSVRRAVGENLERIADAGLLLDVNASPLRDGEPMPYPALWVLAAARRRGVRLTLGDDAHAAADVGRGLAGCLALAAEAGYDSFYYLERGEHGGVSARERRIR